MMFIKAEVFPADVCSMKGDDGIEAMGLSGVFVMLREHVPAWRSRTCAIGYICATQLLGLNDPEPF